MGTQLERILTKGADEVGVYLSPQTIQLFLTYLSELKRWNQKINLISFKSDEEVVVKHFIDSLTLIPYLTSVHSLLDIGSGAGFPGIPLKMAQPELHVTLLEPNRKKVNFQKHIIRTLKLEGITTIHNRAEALTGTTNERLSFDLVTSRALPLESFLAMGTSFIHQGGFLVAFKGRGGREELEKKRETIERLSLAIERIQELNLPYHQGKRYLIFLKKK